VFNEKGHIEHLFDLQFRKYYTALCQFARTYLKNEEAAADLVQDCFVKLWESGELSEKENYIQSYLYTLVRNRCIDTLRRKSVQDKRVGEYTYHAIQWSDEEISEVTRVETIRQLYAALDALPEDTREIVRQHYFEGRSLTEIAATLQENYGKIQKKNVRGIQWLRKQMKPLLILVQLLF
jgi:RNA polymerase sigma-70 factor (ECF subfamily)